MCFAIIAGRLATTDGSVLFGHNEQNFGRNLINYKKVPRQSFAGTAGLKISSGGYFSFSGETYSYLWAESPGLEFSDNCFNEFGVAVAGNGCPSKEDDLAVVTKRGDIIEGGIGYLLPQMIARLSRTAREGVEVAARLIERFGYTGSGRTLIIADAEEAWVLTIVRGKHYLACRVPDDKVVVVPNTYITNQEIAWHDPHQTKSSAGLIEYAIRRGWYDPGCGRPFSFSRAFSAPAKPNTLRFAHGIDSRQWYVQSLLTGQEVAFPPPDNLPFGVVPQHKLDVNAVMSLLRSHLEQVQDEQQQDQYQGLPHRGESKIDDSYWRMACNIATQESSVFQLRNTMPAAIGCLAWRALAVPCLSVYTPWYCGIKDTPYRHRVEIADHYCPSPEIYQDSKMAFWSFYNLAQFCDRKGAAAARLVKRLYADIEQKQFIWQQPQEELFLRIWPDNKELCLSLLTEYCAERAAAAELKALQLLGSWQQ